MAILLNIDTATDLASVCISDDEKIVAIEKSADQKNHASFIQPAVKKLISAANCTLMDIEAIAITNGPGSYTGLRVGLATAKGLCFALNKPLIAINTLKVMAWASIELAGDKEPENNKMIFCPMIDARRMEVFTGMYDNRLTEIFRPAALILNENSFAEYLENQTVVFSGSGHIKFKTILQHPGAIFSDVTYDAGHLAILAVKAFQLGQFADVAYSEPFYLKEFFTPIQPQR